MNRRWIRGWLSEESCTASCVCSLVQLMLISESFRRCTEAQRKTNLSRIPPGLPRSFCLTAGASSCSVSYANLISHHVCPFSSGGIVETQVLHHLRQRDPWQALIIGVALHRNLRGIWNKKTKQNKTQGRIKIRLVDVLFHVLKMRFASSPLKMLTFLRSDSSSSRSSKKSWYCLQNCSKS